MGEALLATQVAVLLLIGRGLGELMQRIRQPEVVGPLLAGLILGPSLFGWVWPDMQHLVFPAGREQRNLLSGIAEIGVMMLLLLTGMETDLGLARRIGRPAIMVTVSGVFIPLCCGAALGLLLPDSVLPDPRHRLVAAAFLGTALSISSIKIVAMVVREMNFMRRDLGQIIVASAIMEDSVGWVIIAITSGIAGAGGFALVPLAKTVIGTVLFLVLSYTIGRTLIFKLIRLVNDYFVSEYAVITAILLVMLVMAMITDAIGVNTVLGAFVAGVLVGESPILTGQIEDRLRGFITAFMAPIFFALSGLSADLTILANPSMWGLLLVLVTVASLGKFAGAFAGAWLGGLGGRQALAIGCGMNARGSTEVIVATIGLSMGVLTHDLYTLIVTMAILTTMAMPPMLRWALARLPMDEHEKQRLVQEEIDAKGFVSKFERVLLAADDSPSGRLASQFAGFISGGRGLPVTVVDIQADSTETLDDNRSATLVKESAAIAAAATADRAHEERPPRSEVIARTETEDAPEAIAKEAERGFDVLFVGIQRMRDEHGTVSDDVNRLVCSFQGPTVLVIAGRAADHRHRILVPISGTEVSRSGAELAFALMPPADAKVVAVHVSRRKVIRGRSAQADGIWHRSEAALLDDVRELGLRHEFEVETTVQLDAAPEEAVLREAYRTGADAIVIGAAKRTGEELYLGKTVAALLERWEGHLVILAI